MVPVTTNQILTLFQVKIQLIHQPFQVENPRLFDASIHSPAPATPHRCLRCVVTATGFRAEGAPQRPLAGSGQNYIT